MFKVYDMNLRDDQSASHCLGKFLSFLPHLIDLEIWSCSFHDDFYKEIADRASSSQVKFIFKKEADKKRWGYKCFIFKPWDCGIGILINWRLYSWRFFCTWHYVTNQLFLWWPISASSCRESLCVWIRAFQLYFFMPPLRSSRRH